MLLRLDANTCLIRTMFRAIACAMQRNAAVMLAGVRRRRSRRESPHLRQIQRLAVAFQHGAAERLMFRAPEGGVGGDQCEGVFACELEDVVVGEGVGVAEFAEAVLAGAEEFAAAA